MKEERGKEEAEGGKPAARSARATAWLNALPALVGIFAILVVLAAYVCTSIYESPPSTPWPTLEERREISAIRTPGHAGKGPPKPTHYTQFPDLDLTNLPVLVQRRVLERLNSEPCPSDAQHTIAYCLLPQVHCPPARPRAEQIIKEVSIALGPKRKHPRRGRPATPQRDVSAAAGTD